MEKEVYFRLLNSLSENTGLLEMDGLTVEVRNCEDRRRGELDPRTALTAGLKREQFESGFKQYDPELWGNGVHLLGPRNTEGRTMLELLRVTFGWASTDMSEGVRSRRICVESPWGPVVVWAYEKAEKKNERPCLLFFHGGGFFAGDIQTVENQCKLIAQRAGALVLSVDYPLAPEDPYPAGVDCCYAVLEWAHRHALPLGIDPGKMAVAGDSAGGNIALVCALRNRDAGKWGLAYQALIYPTLVRAKGPEDPYWYWKPEVYENTENDPAINTFIQFNGKLEKMLNQPTPPQSGRGMVVLVRYLTQDTYPLIRGKPRGMYPSHNNQWYVPEGTDRYVRDISPITAAADGLSKTLIITAEYDFLRMECEQYSRILAKSGVSFRHIRYGGITHGTFDRLGYAPQAEDMVNEIVKDLKELAAV
jgi:acetyl esterase/lipase